MPIASYSYNSATAALTRVLDGLPPVVIAIDGRPGSGKTTLGRYLAWYFNISLVETDLFLESGQGFKYRLAELGHVVSTRLARERPVLLDSIAVGWLLRDLGQPAAFTVYVSNNGPSRGNSPHARVESYEAAIRPLEVANLVIEVCH